MDKTKRINNPNFEACLNDDNNWEKCKGNPCLKICPAFEKCKEGETIEVMKDADDYIDEIASLQKRINCTKNHPEIKPKTCCWQGDALYYDEQEKEITDLKKKLHNNAIEWRDFFKDCDVHQNIGVDRKRLVLNKLDKLEEWKKTLMSEHRSDASLIKTLQKMVRELEK